MKALVLGGAASVLDDVAATEEQFGAEWWDLVVAANDIGCHWPRRLDGWCTLHPNKMIEWVKERDKAGHPTGYTTFAKKGKGRMGMDESIRHPFRNGSSGLFAVAVALHLGATKIILCGVPMTKTGYFEESTVHPQGKTFSSVHSHWKKWLSHADQIRETTRSMSGRTRDLLGAPTAEWLNEVSDDDEA